MVYGSILPAASLVIRLVFVKETTWASAQGWNLLAITGGLLLGGFALLLIGRGDDPFLFPQNTGSSADDDSVGRIANALERIERKGD